MGVLMPNLFGTPVHGNYWGYGNYWEDAIYVGVLPLCLALLALSGSLRRSFANAGLVRFLAIVGAGAFLLSLGGSTPVFPFLFERVPTFDLFQAPTRWNLLLVMSLALMAADGADAWLRRPLLPIRLLRLGTVGAITMVVVSLLARRFLSGIPGTFPPSFAMLGFWLSLAGILALIRRQSNWSMWPGLVGGVVLMDLVLAGWGLNPTQPLSFYQTESRLTEQVDREHRVYMPRLLEYEVKFNWTHRFDTFDPGVDWRLVRDAGLPNTTMLDRIPSADNFDPIVDARYARWIERIGAVDESARQPLLALMDVGSVAVRDQAAQQGIRYERVEKASRVRLVTEVYWASSGQEALELLLDQEVDPRRSVVLEGRTARTVPTRAEGGEAEILPTDDPNRVTVGVRGQGGWLVLSDLWYPGWKARVDDNPVPLYRGNYLFKAVEVPAGEHLVEFQYRPLAFRLGVLLSALGLLGILLWSWILIRS
jgi:hypothetical protein